MLTKVTFFAAVASMLAACGHAQPAGSALADDAPNAAGTVSIHMQSFHKDQTAYLSADSSIAMFYAVFYKDNSSWDISDAAYINGDKYVRFGIAPESAADQASLPWDLGTAAADLTIDRSYTLPASAFDGNGHAQVYVYVGDYSSFGSWIHWQQVGGIPNYSLSRQLIAQVIDVSAAGTDAVPMTEQPADHPITLNYAIEYK
jgi:hypothetical protein